MWGGDEGLIETRNQVTDRSSRPFVEIGHPPTNWFIKADGWSKEAAILSWPD